MSSSSTSSSNLASSDGASRIRAVVERDVPEIESDDYSCVALVFEGFKPTKVIAVGHDRFLAIDAGVGGVQLFVRTGDDQPFFIVPSIFDNINPGEVYAAAYNEEACALALLDMAYQRICIYSDDDFSFVGSVMVGSVPNTGSNTQNHREESECRVHDLGILDNASIPLTLRREDTIHMITPARDNRWSLKEPGVPENPDLQVAQCSVYAGQLSDTGKFALFQHEFANFKIHDGIKASAGCLNIRDLFEGSGIGTPESIDAAIISHDRDYAFVLDDKQDRIYRVSLVAEHRRFRPSVILFRRWPRGLSICTVRGMSTDSAGRLYVCNYHQSKVFVFTPKSAE